MRALLHYSVSRCFFHSRLIVSYLPEKGFTLLVRLSPPRMRTMKACANKGRHTGGGLLKAYTPTLCTKAGMRSFAETAVVVYAAKCQTMKPAVRGRLILTKNCLPKPLGVTRAHTPINKTPA